MQPLTGECEWYKLCSNGKYTARRCPTDGTGQRQMFNPTTNSCTDKVKMPSMENVNRTRYVFSQNQYQ